MKIIKPKYEILTNITGDELKLIELAGRTCYKSEDNSINPYYIYSVASKDKTQTLFCYLKGWSIARCDKYNIYKNTYTTVLYEETGNSCNNNYPSTSMIYTSTGENEFIYACKGTNNDFNLYQFKFQ